MADPPGHQSVSKLKLLLEDAAGLWSKKLRPQLVESYTGCSHQPEKFFNFCDDFTIAI